MCSITWHSTRVMRAMKEILTFPSSSGKGSGLILLTIPCLFRKYILLKSFFTLKQRRILSLHKNKPLFLKPNLEAIKKCVAVRLGVIYEQVRSRAARSHIWLPVDQHEAGRTPCERPAPPCSTPIGRLGVIYDSQPGAVYKNTTKKMEALTVWLKKRVKQHF